MKCLCASTRRAARLMTLRYEEALRPAEITAAQFELMGELRGHPGASQVALAETLAVDQTTLSRNLGLLIDCGWIGRVISTTDRRKASYALTAEGEAVWASALPLWREAQSSLERELGSVGLSDIGRVLDALSRAATVRGTSAMQAGDV